MPLPIRVDGVYMLLNFHLHTMVDIAPLGSGLLSVFFGVLLVGMTAEYHLEAGLFLMGLGTILLFAGWR